MYAVSYRHTERGYAARVMEKLAAERRARQEETSRLREKIRQEEIAHFENLARMRREAAERAALMAAERRALSISYRHSYRSIEARACNLFGFTRNDLYSDRRNRRLVFARQFIAYWACRLTTLSMPQIGKLMGGKDHTTILHGTRAYVEKRAYQKRMLRPISRSIQHRKEG